MLRSSLISRWRERERVTAFALVEVDWAAHGQPRSGTREINVVTELAGEMQLTSALHREGACGR